MTLFSPSGLQAIEECPRKFAWDRVDKVPREGNQYALYGQRVHKIVEAYYKSGVMPNLAEPEGNTAAALLPLLPPPQPGMKIEEHWEHSRFHGYRDLVLADHVYDHKTTSGFTWAKSPETLPHDLQAALYALATMHEVGELRVTLHWNYVTREKRPRVLPVIRTVTFGDISQTVDRAHVLADEGERILTNQIHALDLPPNLNACDAYGGCVHRQRCNLDPGSRMAGLFAQEENMTNASDFQAAMNASHPPATPDRSTWKKANGFALNPATNEWEPDVPAAPPPPPPPPAAAAAPPPPPPPPAAVPINPPPAAAAAPPPPPLSPAAASAPTPPPAAQADAEADHYEALAKGLEAAAAAVRALGNVPKPKRGRPAKG